jgi:GTP pyrophosphokinase
MELYTLTEEEEIKVIQRAYRRLLRSIREEMSPADKKQVREAYEMAVDAHKPQRRKSGEPYILHPIAVAQICAEEMGLGPKAIIAALLHDVVEDTEISLKEIENKFGSKIAMIVDGLTKFTKIIDAKSTDEEEEIPSFSLQAENFRKVLLTMAKDIRVVMIKIADRLHNMRTLGSMPIHKQLKIASETTYVYSPLAHRLGLYAIKSEFEDLCLKITDPEAYHFVTQKLDETDKDRSAFVNKFVKPVKDALQTDELKYRISSRVKSIYSISNKLKKKQIPFEDIYDIFAIRVILDVPKEKEKSACWHVYSIITDIYTPVPERLKDWIAVPKQNGYESLHTTVMGPLGKFVEVQIRTERMDDIAERGLAAHWIYKGVNADNIFDKWLSHAREVLENPNSDAIEVLNDFRDNLFNDEIYAFTPKGEMRYFSKGATALDFAFDIHSEVGQKTKSVKVNGKLVPLSYELRNGDQVEVITSKGQKPTEDWLKIVVTGRARSRIRQSLKEEQRRLGEFGRETLERKLNNWKLEFEENIDFLVKHFGYKNRLDFYVAIANEIISLNDIKVIPSENGRLHFEKVQQSTIHKPEEEEVYRGSRDYKGKAKLLIDGVDATILSYQLASCCNPVQGDEVFAYVSGSGGGAKIHRTNCPNAEHLQATYGYRIKRAEWVDNAEASFIATIRINGIDDLGVVKRLTDVIADQLKVNMRSITMTGDEGYFEGTIQVVINNRDQLHLIIRSIKAIDGVSSVQRVDE